MIDRMKGAGIVLMVFAHSHIPQPFYGAIFIFHMPLFFLLSGYLYKERPLKDVLQRNWQKILKPYLWSIVIVTPVCIYLYGKDWLLTALFTKNVHLICGHDWNGYIGPLWFLLAYFVTMIVMNIVRRVRNIWAEIGILLVLFEISKVVTSVVLM